LIPFSLTMSHIAAGQNAANFPPMFGGGGGGGGGNPAMMQAFFQSAFTSILGLQSRASDSH
jgi:hypothetical protein